MQKNSKNSHTKRTKKSNGEFFKNVCIGIASVGTLLLSIIEYFIK